MAAGQKLEAELEAMENETSSGGAAKEVDFVATELIGSSFSAKGDKMGGDKGGDEDDKDGDDDESDEDAEETPRKPGMYVMTVYDRLGAKIGEGRDVPAGDPFWRDFAYEGPPVGDDESDSILEAPSDSKKGKEKETLTVEVPSLPAILSRKKLSLLQTRGTQDSIKVNPHPIVTKSAPAPVSSRREQSRRFQKEFNPSAQKMFEVKVRAYSFS
jgi:hypothetical protein